MRLGVIVALLATTSACVHATPIKPASLLERHDRASIIKRAQVWQATPQVARREHDATRSNC